MLDIVATREPPVRSSIGRSRSVSAKWPRWLTPKWVSKPSTVRDWSTAISPALLTRRSRRRWVEAN
jgi:hypothetical protein